MEIKKYCKVCKTVYFIKIDDFVNGYSLKKEDVRCCSQECYIKLNRFNRARELKYNKPSHKVNWNPFRL